MKTKIVILILLTALLYSCNNAIEDSKTVSESENKVLTEDLDSSNLWGGQWNPEEEKESRK